MNFNNMTSFFLKRGKTEDYIYFDSIYNKNKIKYSST